jgi:DNA-directed RNA polymerase subunit RPC12/RpoP
MMDTEDHDSGDYGRDLLRSGIIEAGSGNKDAARRYIDRALYITSDHDVMAEGWFWMSQLTDDPVEKRKALENCLSNDLQHARARRALAILDGKLKPDEIVDPDALPPAPEGLHQADAQRFVCPKCGGRMTFAPDGQSLVCEYCSNNQTLKSQPGSAGEKDFIIAMATARGHGKPLAEQVFQCQGCGAQFILPPDQLSVICVYCGSPHVVSLEKSKDLLAPDGIIPHAFDQKHAVQLLVNWVDQKKIKPEKQVDLPRGLYLPLWTFDLGGGIDYTGEQVEDEEIMPGRHQPRVVRISDTYPILISDVPIPASRKLSAPFVRLIPTFDLKTVQPYDARFLSNWPAELYDIPMADGSLDARSQTLARIKRDLPAQLSLASLTSTSSANMTVDSFRLDLLPVWMTEIWFEGRSHLVLINGQNGAVQSDIASKSDTGGLMDWLADLVKD